MRKSELEESLRETLEKELPAETLAAIGPIEVRIGPWADCPRCKHSEVRHNEGGCRDCSCSFPAHAIGD